MRSIDCNCTRGVGARPMFVGIINVSPRCVSVISVFIKSVISSSENSGCWRDPPLNSCFKNEFHNLFLKPLLNTQMVFEQGVNPLVPKWHATLGFQWQQWQHPNALAGAPLPSSTWQCGCFNVLFHKKIDVGPCCGYTNWTCCFVRKIKPHQGTTDLPPNKLWVLLDRNGFTLARWGVMWSQTA